MRIKRPIGKYISTLLRSPQINGRTRCATTSGILYSLVLESLALGLLMAAAGNETWTTEQIPRGYGRECAN